MESVLSLVLLGHDGGEAGESRAWEMPVESVLSLVLVGHGMGHNVERLERVVHGKCQ